MSVIINTSPLKDMIHNGNLVKKWFHNGILVWQKLLDILSTYKQANWSPSGYYSSFSVSASKLSLTGVNSAGSTSGWNFETAAIMRDFFDITLFSTISVYGSVSFYAGGWDLQYAYIDLLNESGSVVKFIYAQSLSASPGTGGFYTINQNIDVSGLSGKYRIRIRILSFANWYVTMDITKMLLSA